MAELRFDGRVVLITGSGRGMGRAHAHLFAERGARVIVNDLGSTMNGAGSSAEPAQLVVDEIRRAGGTALADANDVSTENGANAMMAAALASFGRIDVVIHNAGIVNFTPFCEMTYQAYRKLVSVHQDGSFLVAKAAWPHMMRQNYGRIVLISSLASMPGLAHYASAKAAMCGLVRPLGAEGAIHNIRANALSVMAYTRLMAPFFDPHSAHADLGLHNQNAVEDWWRSHLRPEQVSSVVGWLSHEQCDITGQTLMSAGGYVGLQFTGLTRGYCEATLTPETVHASRQRMIDVEAGFHVIDRPDNWLFERVIEGGAPPLPPFEAVDSRVQQGDRSSASLGSVDSNSGPKH